MSEKVKITKKRKAEIADLKVCKRKLAEFLEDLEDYVVENSKHLVKGTKTIELLKEDFYESKINEYIEFSEECCLLECPIETADEFYGAITEETIAKAMEIIPYRKSNCPRTDYYLYSNLEPGTIYLQGHCCYCRHLIATKSESDIEVTVLANLVQTLRLPKELFVDLLGFISEKYHKNIELVETLWELGRKVPKAFACRCHCEQKTDFTDGEEG